MSNTISGLLTQKPDSPVPQVGGKRRFSIVEKTGKNGKPYNKIKSEGEGYGELYEVTSVQRKDFVDSHGNVSFSVDVTPVSGTPAPVPESPNRPSGRSPDTQARIERQHSQHMTMLLLAMEETAIGPSEAEIRKWTDYFQTDIGNAPRVLGSDGDEIPF